MSSPLAAYRDRPAGRKQDAIRDAVTAFIVDNGLAPGDPLPTEVVMMSELGVGRNALREAMKVLDALGIVEIRHGFGTFVGRSALGAFESALAFRAASTARSGGRGIRELLDVREALELELAPRVVGEGAADLDALSALVDDMEAAVARGDSFEETDWRFHETLYRPLDNQLLIDLLRVFWRVFDQVDDALPGSRYTPAEAAGWHRAIVDALRSGDRGAVRDALVAHFAGIRGRLSELG
jgi:DNA-binding FadR family transcriptional regulator